MNTKRNQKMGMWKRFSTINYSLLTIHSAQRLGISLMEVLASVFVIGVGLLGVLAVIPFGVHQVSKANHADYCSNMLRNAPSEITIREWYKPTTWLNGMNNNGGVQVWDSSIETILADRFFIVNPFDPGGAVEQLPIDGGMYNHVYVIGNNLPGMSEEIMMGQDDLIYTLHNDKRTDFSGTDNLPTSSGKYKWFYTFYPPALSSVEASGFVNYSGIATGTDVDVDILGCYNYIPGDEQLVNVNVTAQYASAARIALIGTEDQLDFSNTKYIFVTWQYAAPVEVSTAPSRWRETDGAWVRVLNSSGYGPSFGGPTGGKYVFVDNKLTGIDNATVNSTRALIIPGVLYHSQATVPFK